jgi:hypothetical protein
MNPLFQEAADYIMAEWDEFTDLKPHHIRKAIQPYEQYLQTLVPPNAVSNALLPYVNRELILYDKYMNDEIQVFVYDNSDDTTSFFSYSEFDEATEEDTEFVNGVKVRDEYDFREQITANRFTGGYWDPKIHWVVEKRRLKEILEMN